MRNKKEKTDRQIYIKFIIMLVAGCIVGFVAGVGGAFLSDMYGGDIAAGLYQIFKVVVPVVYVFLMVLSYAYSFINYAKAKKIITEWNGYDEEVLDEADKRLGEALAPSSIMMVCNFFLYSAMVYISGVKIPGIDKAGFKAGLPIMTAGLVLFLINMVIITTIQKLTIDLTKKINPEKRGNVLDTEFNKEWLASCDEAQKRDVFEAGYKAYQATGYACMVMWLLSLLGMMLFDIGIIPSVCVFVIWLTMVLAYHIAAYKLDKSK